MTETFFAYAIVRGLYMEKVCLGIGGTLQVIGDERIAFYEYVRRRTAAVEPRRDVNFDSCSCGSGWPGVSVADAPMPHCRGER